MNTLETYGTVVLVERHDLASGKTTVEVTHADPKIVVTYEMARKVNGYVTPRIGDRLHIADGLAYDVVGTAYTDDPNGDETTVLVAWLVVPEHT